MAKFIKYYGFFSLIVFIAPIAKGQYLCDQEYRVINKQKKAIKKKTKKIAHQWLLNNADSLNIPKKIKLSRVKYLAEKKEYNKWQEIDSLLCVKKDAELINKAKKRLKELNLVVYDIRGDFNFSNSTNDEIKSTLNFEFNINGELIRAVVRRKKMSPFSETPYH